MILRVLRTCRYKFWKRCCCKSVIFGSLTDRTETMD